MNDIKLREIRAINVLVCILNFHDLKAVGPALMKALHDIFDLEEMESRVPNGSMPERKRQLADVLVTLGEQARKEEPTDQMVVSRMMPYGGESPDLVGWENDLFRQLTEEFEAKNGAFFPEWALRRTGLTRPQNEGMRGVLIIYMEEEGVRGASLSRHAKVGLHS